MNSQFRQVYEFGPFRLDVAGRRFMKGKEAVPLSPKAFDTLAALVRKSGHLVSKEELMREVWPRGSVEESSLSHNICLLRKALGHTADGKLYIETVSKYGYRLVACVRETREGAEPLAGRRTAGALALVTADRGKVKRALGPQAQLTTRALPSVAQKRARAGRPRRALIFFCALLICASLFSFSWMEKRNTARDPRTKSIAVLPFKPINVEGRPDHLGLAVTDATIKRLSTQRQFAVRPSGTVSKYSDPKDDSLTVGHRLGVDAVLEGIVQRSGDDVRVTVQLINVGDGQSLWAQKFDARCSNNLAVQDAISEQLAEALQQELKSLDNEELAKRDKEDTEAYPSQFDISPQN
jgi:TolB-like protein/DNA-binding winged helix-turn-helix (wHTH) protein